MAFEPAQNTQTRPIANDHGAKSVDATQRITQPEEADGTTASETYGNSLGALPTAITTESSRSTAKDNTSTLLPSVDAKPPAVVVSNESTISSSSGGSGGGGGGGNSSSDDPKSHANNGDGSNNSDESQENVNEKRNAYNHHRDARDSQRKPNKRRSFVRHAAGHAVHQVPKFLRPPDRFNVAMNKLGAFCAAHLNFYRIHLLVFTFLPLIFSAIFYASNTQPIAFIDCLFVCFSAMTVTGLTTINISIASPWQQAMLYFLMTIGHISAVSVVMVLIRRRFFQLKFDAIIRRSAKARKRMNDVEFAHQTEKRKDLIRLQRLVGLRKKQYKNNEESAIDVTNEDGTLGASQLNLGDSSRRTSVSTEEIAIAELKAERETRKKERQRKKGPLRADMIRRMDQPAVLVNPMGAISKTVSRRGDEPSQDEMQQDAGQFVQHGNAAMPASGGILNVGGSGDDTNPQQQAQDSDNQNIRIAIAEPHSPTSYTNHQRRVSDPVSGRASHSPERIMSVGDANASLGGSAGLNERRRSSVRSLRGLSPPAEGLTVESAPPMHMEERSRARFLDAEGGDDKLERLRRGSSDPPIGGTRTTAHHERRESDLLPPRPMFRNDMFPRAQTIEFADPPNAANVGRSSAYAHATDLHSATASMRHRSQTMEMNRTPTTASHGGVGYGVRRSMGSGVPVSRTITQSKQTGFGGFPTPLEVAGAVIKRTLPGVQERFKRSTTMARTATFASMGSKGAAGRGDGQDVRNAPYLSFDATVSRNSRFHQLSEAQRDELGGVEYRAIDLLAKLIPLYWMGIYFFCITLVAPWLAAKPGQKTRDVLASQGDNSVGTTWFWFFQVTSAYSNTGMSLIDSSMTQLNDQYMMLIPMGFLILAGNTGFPIFLRLWIWILSKLVPQTSRTYETLRFLLDHPRRCFVYLFPSAQTWFLLLVLVVFNSFDWLMFEVLDLNNPTLESWGQGVRAFDGLFQSIAVRAAGFQIVSILVLAPAVQFLYIVMMYISAYPVAMSVRNTNVYEEKSLGIFSNDSPGEADEPSEEKGGARVWGTYLASHARRQLAFDMWWLGFALWLVCIIERDNITDPSTNGWFTVFSCLFELTSAYGTVGLSTGTPTDNFSLSGRFHTLSKLVVIAVMIRGRHRGLPVAIDRAVLLPGEFNEIEDDMTERAYTIDEDGFIRSRSTYYTNGGLGGTYDVDEVQDGGSKDFVPTRSSTTVYFPRSATGTSLQHYQGAGLASPKSMQQQQAQRMPRARTLSRDHGVVMSPPAFNLDDEDALNAAIMSSNGAHPMLHHQLSSIREASGTPLPTPSPNEQNMLGKSLDAATLGTSTSSSTNDEPARTKGKEKVHDVREREYANKYGSGDVVE